MIQSIKTRQLKLPDKQGMEHTDNAEIALITKPAENLDGRRKGLPIFMLLFGTGSVLIMATNGHARAEYALGILPSDYIAVKKTGVW
jgi:hypothetical protein